MFVAASEKLNSGYIMRPLSWFKKGYTRTRSKIRAYLYGFSRDGNVCNVGYATLRDKLRTSRASIWRGISEEKLGSDFVIEREGGKNSRYTYVGAEQREFSVRTELFFYTEKFLVRGAVRYLTDAEVDVLSLIYTWTRYEKVGKFEGNYKDLANQLGLDYYTVFRAVGTLLNAGLIFRPKKSRNDHVKSVYVANMKKLKALDKLNAKKVPKDSESKETKAVREVDERITLQRDEELRKDKAARAAQACMDKARQVPRFREIAAELGKIEYELAKAELYAPLTLPALEIRKGELLDERAEILRGLGIELWELDEKSQYERLLAHDSRPKGGGS